MRNSEHKQEFTRRVRAAREESNYTQKDIAELLGITQAIYHKYEGRSYMPHFLIHKFCLACRISIHFLFTGEQVSVAQRQNDTSKKKSRTRQSKSEAA